MLYPTIGELTKGDFNRYELSLATARCARIVTDEYVKQREDAEKAQTGNKETDKPVNTLINKELRDEKAVKTIAENSYSQRFGARNMRRFIQKEIEDPLATILIADYKKEFSITKNGAVTIKMLGDKTITSIEIDEDAFDKENKDMVEESIVLGINELTKKIADMEDEINERVTGQKGGFPF